MTAPAAHPLVAAYLEQRQDLARFCRARLGGTSGDVDDLLQDLYLKVSALRRTRRSTIRAPFCSGCSPT